MGENSCDLRVVDGGDGLQEGAAGKKRGPLSSDLNKMAWICHSVYPLRMLREGQAHKTTTT